jgi:hypothetical protein
LYLYIEGKRGREKGGRKEKREGAGGWINTK